MRTIGVLVVCAMAAYAQKNYKPGEYDLYNEVTKDLVANNFSKAIGDLDTWKAKCPESDYAADRTVLYMKAYLGAKQWGRTLDEAAEVLPKMDNLFGDPKDGPGQALQVLYSAVAATPQVADPTASQAAAGEQAARGLLAFDRRPPGVSDEQWSKLRSDVKAPATAALLHLALMPGNRAMTKEPRDCGAAEVSYAKALADYPESSAASYNLGASWSCLKKYAEAVYEYQRAAAIDPTLGGTADPARIRSLADTAYTRLHGSEEGLEKLKQQVKDSALPPAGFTIQTASQLAAAKEAEFEQSNPQLALWMKIKAALADANGTQYFESQLKDSAVPQLKGTLVEGRPACRSKELRIAVPMPGEEKTAPAEIALKLDKPLTGKPEVGTQVQWEGVPSDFTANPFLLTMDANTATIRGLKMTPCAPAVPRKK